MRRLRINPRTAAPAAGRWLGQFGAFSIMWLLLAALAPIAWGWEPRAIISGSMEPRIHTGDVVVIAPGLPKDLKKGQVMSFTDPNNPGRVLTHRLVQRHKDGTWQTKGDANPTPDSAPIKTSAIVGKPRILVPWVGYFAYWVSIGKPAYAALAAVGVTLAFLLAFSGASDQTKPATPGRRRARSRRLPSRRGRSKPGLPADDTTMPATEPSQP